MAAVIMGGLNAEGALRTAKETAKYVKLLNLVNQVSKWLRLYYPLHKRVFLQMVKDLVRTSAFRDMRKYADLFASYAATLPEEPLSFVGTSRSHGTAAQAALHLQLSMHHAPDVFGSSVSAGHSLLSTGGATPASPRTPVVIATPSESLTGDDSVASKPTQEELLFDLTLPVQASVIFFLAHFNMLIIVTL